MPVKIGNITNLSDARYGAGMGVDYLGFPLGRGIAIATFKDIVGWISGPALVIEWDDPAAAEQMDLPELIYQIQVEQVHHIAAFAPEQKWIVSGTAASLLLAQPTLLPVQSQILFLEVVDATQSPNETLAALADHFRVWAQIETVEAIPAVTAGIFEGIALRGFDEERAGLKDYGALAEILETLEVID